MKKLFLILFILSQLISSTDINFPSEVTHGHEHSSTQGIKHIHEHNHVENALTLFCQIPKDKEINPLPKLIFLANIKKPKILIINNIYRPPIS